MQESGFTSSGRVDRIDPQSSEHTGVRKTRTWSAQSICWTRRTGSWREFAPLGRDENLLAALQEYIELWKELS